MEGSGGSQTSASPPAIPSQTVCCMCGDLGLSEEFFSCSSCLFRSQHKYCSELYPKAAAYSNCNWCLREASCKLIAGEPMSDGSSSSSSAGDALILASKFHRGHPLLQMSIKPAKKLRLAAEGSPPPASKMDEKERSKLPFTGSRGVIRQVFRGKVRRYKLLEEVSS